MVQILGFLELVGTLEAELGPIMNIGKAIGAMAFIGAVGAAAGVNPLEPQNIMNRLVAADVAGARAMGRDRFQLFIGQETGLGQVGGDSVLAGAIGGIEAAMGQGPMSGLLAAAFEMTYSALTGGRTARGLADQIGTLPDKMGLPNFCAAMMTFIYQIWAGPSLTRYFNHLTHPQRIDMPTLVSLFRGQKISAGDYFQRAGEIGWSPGDADLLQANAGQGLTIAEMQDAYQFGLLSEVDIANRLFHAGFSPADIQIMLAIYLKRTESAGGDFYRSVARGALLAGTISISQFEQILSSVNVPPASIALEVAAVTLERDSTRQNLTVTQIKAAFQAGDVSESNARQQLAALTYAPAAIDEVVQTWKSEAKPETHGLSEQRILQYLESGVITAPDAYKRLIALNLTAADAALLVAHPEARPPHIAHDLTPETILAAYVDGILTVDDTLTRLKELGESQSAATLRIEVAQAQARRRTKKPAPPKVLSLSQAEDFFTAGLVSETWLERWLTDFGYTDSDAALITALQVVRKLGARPAGWQIQN